MVTMEDLHLGLNITANLSFTIAEKVLTVMGEVDIGLRPATPPPITHVGMVDYWVYLLLLVPPTKVFTVMKKVIVVVMMEELDLGLKRISTITFKIVEKVLMVMGELDICIRIDTTPIIIQVGLVDFWISMIMVII